MATDAGMCLGRLNITCAARNWVRHRSSIPGSLGKPVLGFSKNKNQGSRSEDDRTTTKTIFLSRTKMLRIGSLNSYYYGVLPGNDHFKYFSVHKRKVSTLPWRHIGPSICRRPESSRVSLFLFLFIRICRFFRVFCFFIAAFSLFGEYAVRSFLPDAGSLRCDHGLDFDTSLCENSINQKLGINRVARKIRTYFEMGTDGQRFVCLKSGISILRRYL